MATYTRILLLSMLIASICCWEKPSIGLTSDDYAVYSAYLNEFAFYKNVPSAGAMIIDDSTGIAPHDIHPKVNWSILAGRADRCHYLNDTACCHKVQASEWHSVFEEFKRSSLGQQQVLVPAKLVVHYPIQLLSQFRKRSLIEHQDKDRMYYLFRLSKISYNIDKTKALFFGSIVCGGTCGRGELVILEKVKDAWVLIDTFRFWIA